MSLIDELKRRNVFKVGGAYLALAWVVAQITGTIVPALNLPAALLPMVVWIGVIGFPFVVVFAWVYELTPEGLKRESEVDRSASITHLTSRRLDYTIIGLMVLAIGLFVADRVVLHRADTSSAGAGLARDGVEAGIARDADASSKGAGLARDTYTPGSPVQQQTPIEKSIAVLPFADMSSAKDQEYMSDGIAEELLNLLTKIPELQVTSRSSAFSYKGKDIKLEQVARELRVAHILEGSVRTSGNRVRITAQLIDTRTDTHLWSETYDRTLDDIFAVQDEIAAAVVGQLKVTLLGTAPSARPVNPEAYALYLQARQLNSQATALGWTQAVELYRKALAIDASYAAAWSGLSTAYSNQAGSGQLPFDQGLQLAREAADKALAADPALVSALANLANLAMAHDNDLSKAARLLERALALEPANLHAIGAAATLASSLDRMDLSIALDEFGRTRDPINATAHANLGISYSSVGRQDDAIASFRTAMNLSPGRSGAYYNMGSALLLKGDNEAALTTMQQEPAEVWRMAGLPMALHAVRRHSEYEAALAQLIGQHEKEMAYNIAYVLAFSGQGDRAFEWLDKAVAYKDPGLSAIATEPLFASIHADPRWLPFLRRIGKAPEQLAAIRFEVKVPNAHL